MQHPIHTTTALLSLSAALFLSSCATSVVQTKQSQASLSPAQAVEAFKQVNDRFVSGHGKHRDLQAQARKTAAGQYPFAAVLGCIDSRASNEIIFDQGIGDIFSARVAGNVLNDDLLGSLEYAAAKAGAKAIVVVGHTGCGAVGGACANVKLGHVTGLVDKIKPSVRKVLADPHAAHQGPAFENRVAEENVKYVTQLIRQRSTILRDLERQGKLQITAGIYHLDTGKVEFFDRN